MYAVFVALALVAFLAAAPAVKAASTPDKDAGDAAAMFTTMDTNKDGVLTKEEFAAHGMANDFAKADGNGDGNVTRDE